MSRDRISVSVLASYYRSERYLRPFLDCVARQTIASRIELILVHNVPTAAELAIIRSFARSHPGLVRHLTVEDAEPLPASWNRGARAAASDHLAIWNVDDRRTDDSLERQLAVLESDPVVVATYGDWISVGTYGSAAGRYFSEPEFDRETFTQGYHLGPFPMWRRSAMEVAGFFDEQLLVSADFDLFVRMAFNGTMKKTGGLLGHWLHGRSGLSSRANSPLPYERTLVQLRYGMYGRVDYRRVRGSRSYSRNEILYDGRRRPVESFVAGYGTLLRKRSRARAIGYVNFVLTHLLRGTAGDVWRTVVKRVG